jgi:hypothetical protein
MISEVQGALRKSGGFVFGDRLPFLAISTCGTLFTEASQERGTFLRRQGETALTHIKFFLVTGSELASLRPVSRSILGSGALCRGWMLWRGGIGGSGTLVLGDGGGHPSCPGSLGCCCTDFNCCFVTPQVRGRSGIFKECPKLGEGWARE